MVESLVTGVEAENIPINITKDEQKKPSKYQKFKENKRKFVGRNISTTTYTPKDAMRFYSKLNDPDYLVGEVSNLSSKSKSSYDITETEFREMGKIYSIEPRSLKHVKYDSEVLYEFRGSPTTWDYDMNRRHYYALDDYIDLKSGIIRSFDEQRDSDRMTHVYDTMRQSKLDYVLYRWQTIKEARHTPNKIYKVSTLSGTLQRVPFLGLYNAINDLKRSADKIQNKPLNYTAKAGFLAATVAPYAIMVASPVPEHIDLAVAATLGFHLPIMSKMRSVAGIAASYGMRSTFRKKKLGEFAKGSLGEDIPARDHMFPYAYGPVKSVKNTIHVVKFMNAVWDNIPHYRRINEKDDIRGIFGEIEKRTVDKLNTRQKDLLNEVLSDIETSLIMLPSENIPMDFYPKHYFIPSMYLNAPKHFTKF